MTSRIQDYRTKCSTYWEQEGEKSVLELFGRVSSQVPAYRDFLNLNAVSSIDFSTYTDCIAAVPTVDKDGFLRKYSRADLCAGGIFGKGQWIISATSGSTGVPFYFPRSRTQDEMYADTAEAYMVSNFCIDKRSTLYINAFPMGVWIGGVFTYEAIMQVAERGYDLSIITPGINKIEVVRAMQNLCKDFDQIVIGSYAPFLKDILDEGEKEGLIWSDYCMKFVFSAEAFSEEFRDYVQQKTGLKDIYRDTLNHYGTVDLGTMAHETPMSIMGRRLATQNPELFVDLFGDVGKLPTFAQYDPSMFYFEEDAGNLYCSSDAGLPLFRYDLKDHGGVRRYDDVLSVFAEHSVDLVAELKAAGLEDTIWELPFVFVYERSDFSVSYFAFQIYPETIRRALLREDIRDIVSGKCAMEVTYEGGDQFFDVHVELIAGSESNPELKAIIKDAITGRLLDESSEFRKTSEEYGVERVAPRVHIWPYAHEPYFTQGGKQKWVVRK